MGANGDGDDNGAEIARLAGIAAGVNYVEAVHSLPGGSTFAAYVQRISAEYWATHDDDLGYGAWMQARWGGAQRAWSADLATVTGDAPPPEIGGPDAGAILEAAEALRAERREERTLGPGHAADLFAAVARRRGPFILRLEAELLAYYRAVDKPTKEGQDAHLAPHREELGRLFRADVEAVIREARGE